MSKGLSYKYSGTKGHIVSVASSLPKTYKSLLGSGWTDISDPRQSANGHYELQEKKTGLRIRFDKKVPGAPGFKGKNHYHIYNPNATGNKDLYLDASGNPVKKNSKASHILPKEDN